MMMYWFAVGYVTANKIFQTDRKPENINKLYTYKF